MFDRTFLKFLIGFIILIAIGAAVLTFWGTPVTGSGSNFPSSNQSLQ